MPENQRYFTDGSGNAVYLTGSHTWQAFRITVAPIRRLPLTMSSIWTSCWLITVFFSDCGRGRHRVDDGDGG